MTHCKYTTLCTKPSFVQSPSAHVSVFFCCIFARKPVCASCCYLAAVAHHRSTQLAAKTSDNNTSSSSNSSRWLAAQPVRLKPALYRPFFVRSGVMKHWRGWRKEQLGESHGTEDSHPQPTLWVTERLKTGHSNLGWLQLISTQQTQELI